jgi:diguanylate cyclase (GGDEF)-like protein
MISLKKYWDSAQTAPEETDTPSGDRTPQASSEKDRGALLPVAIAAYQSALREMGACSMEACPALGQGLMKSLAKLDEKLSSDTGRAALEATEKNVRERLQDWGRSTATHYRLKTAEVKDLLIVMARTAESVGERDQRCAGQISEVTTRLKKIASLDDLTEIRASIEKSAAELKTSVDRMATEGKQAIAALKAEVSVYQTKLEEAEELASKDALTGMRNRSWVENEIERRIRAGGPLSVAIVDIDDFKRVNDVHGHLVGDELLRQFAGELKSACRSTDVNGRWGGDEFILVLGSRLHEAESQIERLRDWVCGSYPVQSRSGPMKLKLEASIGLAEHRPGERMNDLLARADAAMYERKAAVRAGGANSRR